MEAQMNRSLVVLALVGILMFGSTVWAGERATPKDVYELVVKAYEVLSTLGEDALPAFNDPKGEFVYKDTYVYVLQCPEYVVAHPFAIDKLKGRDLSNVYPHQKTLCEGDKNSFGGWVEYEWPKPGSDNPERKISFVLQVKGTPYTVSAGIYNSDLTIAQLNGTIR
jgi:hypothetical protein